MEVVWEGSPRTQDTFLQCSVHSCTVSAEDVGVIKEV